MNIRYLKELLDNTREIMVIGKTAEVNGVVCHVMGVVRDGTKMRLLVLQYDEEFHRRVQEAEVLQDDQDFLQYVDENSEDYLSYIPEIPQTNRMVLLGTREIEATNPFQGVRKIAFGEGEFEVNSWGSQLLSAQDWKSVLLLYEFLHHAWQPDGIDLQSIDRLFLTSMELDGEYTAIPSFGENPILRFIMGPESIPYPVEQPIKLVVGENYPNKLWFQNGVNGEEHWAHINRVYLMDVWAEMEKNFANDELQEQMNQQQLSRIKADFEKRLLKICPRGMCFPVIEYECEQDISLQFYSQAYLDAIPVNRNSSMGFSVQPNQPTGKLGMKLMAEIIQEPFPENTASIDAELFQYYQKRTSIDIVLK
jgi:hypothetical protein